MTYQLLADQPLTNLCYDALNCLVLNAPRQFDSPACSVFSERCVDAPPWVLCEKGKPVVRRGRKATGLLREIAGFPNRGRGDFPKAPSGKGERGCVPTVFARNFFVRYFPRIECTGSRVNRPALPKNASGFVITERVGTRSIQDLGEQMRRWALCLLLRSLRLRKDFLAVWRQRPS
jgi:hypothetical protein